MGALLRILTGPFGSWIAIAAAAAFVVIGAYAGVQTWRVHSLQVDVAQAGADLHVAQGNAARCLASVADQNHQLEVLKGRCDTESSNANAGAAAELARLRERDRRLLASAQHGPAAMNQFFAGLQ